MWTGGSLHPRGQSGRPVGLPRHRPLAHRPPGARAQRHVLGKAERSLLLLAALPKVPSAMILARGSQAMILWLVCGRRSCMGRRRCRSSRRTMLRRRCSCTWRCRICTRPTPCRSVRPPAPLLSALRVLFDAVNSLSTTLSIVSLTTSLRSDPPNHPGRLLGRFPTAGVL